MKPLAYRMRPTSLNDIVGQDHLVGSDGVITNMLAKNILYSMILYGNPGTGKTTIASIIAEKFSLNNYFFNASIDTKQKLKDIISNAKYGNNIILIIDEIHRMNKDIQDYLLPFLEDGSVTLIGLTTTNPYHTINLAIRSRCLIFKLNDLTDKDIRVILNRALENTYSEMEIKLDEEVFDYIIDSSNFEVRTALNMLEVILLSATDGETIFLPKAKRIILKPAKSLDKNGDNYYDTISALQKSIRGSDVNASLHYLSRLLESDDFEILARRLLVIAYEDIGLANPQIGPRCVAAIDSFRQLGMPEGVIPLSVVVCDMALSPKSNSAYTAIYSAIDDYKKNSCGPIPNHLKNGMINSKQTVYKYPHDYPGDYVVQQYLPDAIKDHIYYRPKLTSNYEKQLAERYDIINKLKSK